MKKIAFALLLIAVPSLAFADVSIHLTVVSPSGTLYDQTLSVPACPVTNDFATTTVSGKCALETAGMNPQWTTSGDDLFLTQAGGVSQDFANNLFWGWWQNLAYGQTALNKHALQDGEHLLVAIGVFPLKINVSANPTVGATSTVTVQEFGFDSSFNPVWNPSSGATVHFGSMMSVADASGTVDFFPTSANSISVFAEKTGFVKSDTSAITPATPPPPTPPIPVQIQLDIKTSTTTVFSGPATVPACTTSNNPTSTVNGFCAFAAAGLPITTTHFSFGDQIDSIGGYAAGVFPNSWLWFLNGNIASVGIDSYALQTGDKILWTLGIQPMKISISTEAPQVGATTTVTVLGFNAVDFAFEPVPNAAILGTDLFTNANGLADITATSTDALTISATSTGFLPSSSITLHATAAPPPPPPPTTGGGSSGISHTPLNISLALSYLSAQQHSDGSYGAGMFSDWTAIAFNAVDPGTAKIKLSGYLLSNTPQLSSVTDYERHAMALEAFNINPYNGTSVDYIAHIVSSFDGTQIGDAGLDNDDIFALFPLIHAGYSSSDDIIKKTATFILSKQHSDGSWDGSADMTAAAMQALGPLFVDHSLAQKLGPAFGKAVGYLTASQQPSGSWSNVDSTSWVQTMINSVNEGDPTRASNWATSLGYLPTDAIGSQQQSDGAVKPTSETVDTRVWSTAYAVVAASGKSWQSILHTFSKPAIVGGSSVVTSGGGNPYATSTSATTTSATSTPPVATTTPAVVPQVLGASTSTISTTTIETATTTTPQIPAKHLTLKKHKKTPVNHAQQAVADTPKSETSQSDVMPLSQTAAAQNAGGFFSRVWSAVTSWLKKII